MVDGEMQAERRVVPEMREADYPWSKIQGDANVLIFPNLDAGNIAYKLLGALGGAEAIGPMLHRHGPAGARAAARRRRRATSSTWRRSPWSTRRRRDRQWKRKYGRMRSSCGRLRETI